MSSLEWLKFDDYREIAEKCEASPKSATELARLTKQAIREIAEKLERLEKCNIVEYTPNGWKCTEVGIKLLSKYFK